MSILDVTIANDGASALVLADIAAWVPGKWVSKLAALHHLGAVLAFRGQVAFGATVASVAMCTPATDLDELLGGMRVLVDGARAALREFGASTGESVSNRNEIVVAGWSPAQARVIGRAYVVEGDSIDEREISRRLLAPSLLCANAMPQPLDTPGGLAEFARLQNKLIRLRSPSVPINDLAFIVAEIDQHQVTVRRVTPRRMTPEEALLRDGVVRCAAPSLAAPGSCS